MFTSYGLFTHSKFGQHSTCIKLAIINMVFALKNVSLFSTGILFRYRIDTISSKPTDILVIDLGGKAVGK